MTSDAVTAERISRIVGYKLSTGNFQTVSPNLPMRIAVLAEANDANQATLDVNAKQITSAKQAGDLYGYGSPIEQIARILIPYNGGGIGGIPVIVYPQAAAVGATSKIITITPSGTATGNGTHTIKINGRTGLDGTFYDIAINSSDNVGAICEKIANAVNNVINAPCSAVDYDYNTRLETKWKGETANDFNVEVDTNGDALGITYTIATVQSATGTPSVAGALAQFGANWNTLVVNSYTSTTIMSALEAFNGKPDTTNPTGRFVGIVMKPFVAITGTIADDPSSISDARENEVTIAFAPAPNSKGLPLEAAANMCVLQAVIAQNNPHLDVAGKSYPDMPTPTSIGSMSDYNNRDLFVKKGCSTVDLVAGQYVVQDFVTTYHKTGENPPQFRYVRNLFVDFNVRYSYYLLEQIHVVDKVLAGDKDVVTAGNVIKPKQWKQLCGGLFEDLARRALIVDVQFSKDNLLVNLSSTNPDRLETKYPYKRTGIGRILSTTVEAGFNFGNV